MRRILRNTVVVMTGAVASAAFSVSPALAAYITVHGGPTFTNHVGFMQAEGTSGVNDAGTAVGDGWTSYPYGTQRSARWDGSGAAPSILGTISPEPSSQRLATGYGVEHQRHRLDQRDGRVRP